MAEGVAILYAQQRGVVGAEPANDRPLLREGAWNLETNRFGHYVVFDADEATAQLVVERLDSSSLGVRRWDASRRAADDGRLYDWFVRLGFEGERDECLAQVRSLLSSEESTLIPATQFDGVPAHLRDAVMGALQKALVVARENSDLQDEAHQLRAQLSTAHAEAHQARQQLTDETARMRSSLGAMEDQTTSLRRSEELRRGELNDRIQQLRKGHEQQLSALREQLAAASSSQAGGDRVEIDTLRAQIGSTQRDMDELMSELEQSWDAGQLLTDRLSAAVAQVTALAAESAAAKQEARQTDARLAEVANELQERATAQRVKAAGGRRPDLQTFLDKLFRRCDLDADSIEELFKFDRTDKAIHELLRIDRDDPQLHAVTKKVQGYPGWWELSKVNTGASGKSAMGRIYYRHHVSGVQAVVHLKRDDDEQRRFMAKRLGSGSKS